MYQALPYSAEIEKSVLGSILLGKQDYMLKLSEVDFYDAVCQTVFNAMKRLVESKQTIDVVSVANVVNDKFNNSYELISDIALIPPTPENIEHYIEQLKNYTTRREIIKASHKAIDMATKGVYETGVDLKNDVLQAFDVKTYEDKTENFGISSIMVKVLKDVETKYNAKNEEKLFTGFYDLDKLTAGLHPEEMTIIAARPGVGKSAIAIQLMIQLAIKKNCCLFVSREMSTMQIGKRILSNIAQIDGHKLRFCKALRDDDWLKISKATGQISALPIEINDRIATIQEVRSYCRELKTKNAIDLLIVDYLQLMRSMRKFDSYRLEISDISRQLKEISLEFSIPVIALSQLSRDATGSNEPELHHLKESGSLEQDADNVIFLHVPKDTDERQDGFDIKIIIAKQRNGPTGYTWLRYYRKTFKFANLAREYV